ncbi:GNAT family N-acetyltransferase [Paenibacillus albus]|uniref:GNAT family N-acetyltransferase n=1 Tax=Paenibacillus albus TaxID=2495582 RepID=A0A3S9A5V2_9BACL|nr:GNAT family N-acetyltransferase [Paenibacillus albus]AZN41139.1 GNAT family N-acetyltransferase [Paenibacillus albus]
MFTSRPLEESDLARICTFVQNEEELQYFYPAAKFPLTPEQIVEKVQTRQLPTCILHENEVVAFANLYQVEDKSCFLGNVIIAPAFRGRGAAAFLLETMIDQAKARFGITVMKLITHNTNTRGLIFYRKHGFIPVELLSNRTDAGEYIVGIRMERSVV